MSKLRQKNSLRNKFPQLKVTIWLIILNVFFFIVFSILFAIVPNSQTSILLQSSQIIQGQAWWTLITSMFMHQGIFHLFVNMFSLFFLGSFCEQLIGRKRFLWIYFLSGIFAAIFFVVGAALGSQFTLGPRIFGSIDALAAGASGALFGLLGILALLIPRYRVYLIVGPIIVFILIALLESFSSSPLIFILSLLLNISLFLMVFSLFLPSQKLRRLSLPVALPMWLAPVVAIVPLVLLSLVVELPIGNSAHLGGLIVGLIYGLYLRLKYPQKMLLLKRFFK